MLAGLGLISKLSTKGHGYRLSQSLVSSDFVYFKNIDERKFVEGRLFYDLKKVDYVVTGSSRMMQINSELMGAPILNLSVSGAAIEDYVAILIEAVAKMSPHTVYIGADPWLLNKHDNLNDFKSIEQLYFYWASYLDEKNTSALKPFFSHSQNANIGIDHTNAFQKLYTFTNLFDQRIPTNDEVESVDKKSYDGWHIYNESYSNNASDISLGFDNLLAYAMQPFDYDARAEDILVKLIRFLKIRGISVNLVLAPYHPDLFNRMKEEKLIFLQLETKFRAIAKKNKIKILGSYDPNVVKCFGTDFFDGSHPKASCMANIEFINREN